MTVSIFNKNQNKVKKYIFLFLYLLCCILFFNNKGFSLENDFIQKVETAVSIQMKKYPASSLGDIYKSFFQDRFGPGHMISDPAAAENYLKKEISSYDEITGDEIETIGWEHNFYRVNLSLIKRNIIPFDEFFAAFMESAGNIILPSAGEWEEEWRSISKIIDRMNLDLPDAERDKKNIDGLFVLGKFDMHHSPKYIELYLPHYRIISVDVFERKLRYFCEKSD